MENGAGIRYGLSSSSVLLLLLLLLIQSTEEAKKGFDISRCDSALGMQNGFIKDSDITASSSIDGRRKGPTNSRIRTEKGDGAWCPKTPISSDTYEYLEIDLRQLKVIKLVETQGRFENGQGTEYADQYRLEYRREDGADWFRYRNRRGHQVIQGNSNTYIAEMREIKPPIIAQRIRFVPVSNLSRSVCLRVELYGCSFPDGVISYEMPQGHRYGLDVDLLDRFYDGTVSNGVLRDGLGLLMDGDEGQANFQLDDPDESGVKSHQWIAWKNESLSTWPLSILFKFDAVRNFSMAYIRCNNMFSKGTRVFRLVRMYFGLDGDTFDHQPQVKFTYARDNQAEYARTVKVPLENHIGRYIKMELVFEVKWIMISEIHFESEYAMGDVIRRDDVESGRHVASLPSHVTRISGFLGAMNEDDVINASSVSPSPQGNDVIYINDWVIKTTSNPKNSSVSGVTSSFTTVSSWNQQPRLKIGLDYGSVVVMIIVFAVLLLVLCSVLVLIFYRRHKLTCLPRPCGAAKSSAILTNPPSTCSISRPSSLLYPSSYLIHSTSSSYRPPPAFPVPPYSGGCNSADEPSQCTASDLLLVSPSLVSPSLVSPSLVSPYATIDLPEDERLVEIQSDESSSSSSSLDGIYSTPSSLQLLQAMSPSIPSGTNIPRSSLKFVRSLGKGHFGQVYVCEVLDAYGRGHEFGSGLMVDGSGSLSEPLVSVQVLQHNASELKRSLFEREVRKLSRLQDPNIASMLTCYTDQEPFCVVLEYSRSGDLKSFLRERASEQSRRDDTSPGSDLLSYGCLVFLASQIASGMKYFEEQGLVHRDLSARNCIVSEDLTIKISDLGVGHHQYPEDYSTLAGQELLPIRWMPWESVLLGRFTIKSDVWAFGITVWEILTFAVDLPYSDMTDEAVVDNCHTLYCENDSADAATRLVRPWRCPRELYDLLFHCWVKDESQRPSFREVNMFLQKKSAGFKPETDRVSCVKA